MVNLARHITRMTLDDAEHYTAEQRQAIVDSYPEHERDARTKGIPTFGSGLVFPVADSLLEVDAFQIPAHWSQINGLDFGYDHPFAATRNAWDKDNDVWYVINTYRERAATPITHAAALRPWGEWIPCAWPHDGLQHDKGSGEELGAIYAAQHLNMLPTRAEHESGGNGVEAGIIEMLDRMQSGRFKVFKHLVDWYGEKRTYHRKDGKIVKLNDDLISSTRYALMMRRFAETEPRKRVGRHSGGGGWMG